MSCNLDLHFPSDEVGHLSVVRPSCTQLICTHGKAHFCCLSSLGGSVGIEPRPVSRPLVPTPSEMCAVDCTKTYKVFTFYFLGLLYCVILLYFCLCLLVFLHKHLEFPLPFSCK